jgi:O-antigen ligase
MTAIAGRWFVKLIGALALIGIMVSPFAAQRLITPQVVDFISQRTTTISAQHRLTIWRFVSEKIMEKPLTGWGLDASRAMPGGKDKIHLHVKQCQSPCYYVGERLPLHPHNLALQLWLELGLPGAALGAIAIFGLFRAIAIQPITRWDRALLTAQSSAGLVISGLSYGAWQAWWLSSLALAGALSVCMLNQRSRQKTEQKPENSLVEQVMDQTANRYYGQHS